ncbi:hypothetical protein [Oscillatoria sp. FACHB-1406]|uniref:hypothetical protein n=1 Tax=Oscillatoria sp. FACHB-1406 TaxID=2692846 RepID=UPI001689C824|nr:hypothetical protein [Oscillatoria sp. FACHB-1406]MBD2577304.1 hypothetical protein [Oscillatoria sp. FACHB-1406]
MNTTDYPFVRETIADDRGNVRQVILDLNDYLHFLEYLEDEGLYRAMQQVKAEKPLSRDAALAELDKD